MTRKTANDFNPEVLKLFDEYYIRGVANWRGFIERAAKFAIGGLTALGLLEALSPPPAEGQQVIKDFGRVFAIGVALNCGFVVIETVFGLLSNSLALLADAGHNFSDVFGLLLAWGANVLVQKRPTQRHTYGLGRASILAALMNALILLVAVGVIACEAILRFGHPESVASSNVILVASVGILINGFTAYLFMSGKEQDVNIRGAYLHMAADAAISLGVVVAAIAMHFTGWLWLDPAVSFLIAIVIGVGTWDLLCESLNLALDGVPASVQLAKVSAYLASIPSVHEVRELYIWALSTTETALTVHLVKSDAAIDDALLVQINNGLREQFEIHHITVQFERLSKNGHRRSNRERRNPVAGAGRFSCAGSNHSGALRHTSLAKEGKSSGCQHGLLHLFGQGGVPEGRGGLICAHFSQNGKYSNLE